MGGNVLLAHRSTQRGKRNSEVTVPKYKLPKERFILNSFNSYNSIHIHIGK